MCSCKSRVGHRRLEINQKLPIRYPPEIATVNLSLHFHPRTHRFIPHKPVPQVKATDPNEELKCLANPTKTTPSKGD